MNGTRDSLCARVLCGSHPTSLNCRRRPALTRLLAAVALAAIGLAARPDARAAADPTALAGGPYVLNTGGSVVLEASHSNSPSGAILRYEWDINGDGRFGDLTGPRPTLAWSDFRLKPGTTTITLRVTDTSGRKDSGTARINVVAAKLATHDHFRFATNSARLPGVPAFGPDGRLYGVATLGGLDGAAAVWRLDASGRGLTILQQLPAAAGTAPRGPVFGPDGRLYGASGDEGQKGGGTVWRINLDGSNFELLHAFDTDPDGGSLPDAPAFVDGWLYGVTGTGGSLLGVGTAWRMKPDGRNFTVLHRFVTTPAGATPDGAEPTGAPVLAGDGYLYGATRFGGDADTGTLWRMKPDGTGFRVLRSMAAAEIIPMGRLRLGADQKLYGAGMGPGPGGGVVWRMNRDGTGFAVLRVFRGAQEGTLQRVPSFGGDGRLYGTSVRDSGDQTVGFWRMNADGSGFVILRRADYGGTVILPTEMVLGPDRRFYGSAYVPGNPDVVWRVSADGKAFDVLAEFVVRNNGYIPYGPPVFGPDGRAYGLTFAGGETDSGVLWRMSRDGGDFCLLHEFDSEKDGSSAYGTLALGPKGILYGTSPAGGKHGFGTVWRVTRDGDQFAVLHHFDNDTEGSYPQGEPVFGPNGMTFGANLSGGANGGGTLWRMRADGSGFTVLRHFALDANGASPAGSPVVGPEGRLYGANFQGGNAGAGTVWRANADGSQFTVLHHFAADTEGWLVAASPIVGPDGRLYGVNALGGAQGFGTLWRMNRDGTGFTVLHPFADEGDAAGPLGAPVFGADGRIYGVATTAGDAGGTLWRIKPDGSGYEVMEHFSKTPRLSARGGVRFGPDGRLWGSATGGADDLGVVYSWAK